MTTSGRRFDPFVAFLVLACIGLAVVSMLLARQNRELKQRIAGASAYATRQADALKPGDLVQPFGVIDASGLKTTIGFGEGETKTILLVYSSTCPSCQQTIPRWTAVLSAAPHGAVRILAIEKDHQDPATSVAASVVPALPFPTYTTDRADAELAKRLPFVPATVILDDKGVVTQAWFGVPNQGQEEELLRALGSSAS